MEPNSGILREFEEDLWTECPHCGAHFRTWDSWFGSTLWVRDGDGMDPVPKFSYCPNCGEDLNLKKKEGEGQCSI